MIRTLHILAAVLVIWCCAGWFGASVAIAQDAPADTTSDGMAAPAPRVAGYYAWWMGDAWREMDLSLYDRIVFFTTRVDSAGFIRTRNGWPEDWTDLQAAADSAGAELVPTVAMMRADTILPVFGDSVRWTRLLNDIELMMDEAGSRGVHLDVELFEPAPDTVATGFMTFVRALRERLPPDRDISMFSPAFDVSRLYDLRVLAPHVDAFYVQGYDLHWLNGPSAGPVAPLDGWAGSNWRNIVARYREAGISDDRIVMTLPYFGYEWPVAHTGFGAPTVGEGQILTYARVDSTRLPDIQRSVENHLQTLGLLRDDPSGSPFYTRADSAGVYQGWFEDETSLESKLDFIEQEGLAGAAVFLMGYDNGLFEPLLRRFRERQER